MSEQPLPTWTRTLNEQDAMELLDAASPGLPLEEWRELAHAILPQSSRSRRQELVRIVERDLLDHDGIYILDAVYLELFQAGSPHERNALLIGRLLTSRPLVAPALERLVHPALAQADEPLAPRDAGMIPEAHWDRLLRELLPTEVTPEPFRKTRQTLQRFLGQAGVLDIQGNTKRTIRAQRARPPAKAYGWLLAHELREEGRAEAPLSWALSEAHAARLFAPAPYYAQSCVDQAVAAGLLRKGYLLGDARLHPGPRLRG